MADAYEQLHVLGYSHSIEAWLDGELVGGLYGLALGSVFFGESMFTHRTDASKVALASLVGLLKRQGVAIIDCQQETAHLATLGARPISRRQFARHLAELIHSSEPPGAWPRGVLVQDTHEQAQ
jgi:leucyl/phenylalanyl-tRNA--protein transferase